MNVESNSHIPDHWDEANIGDIAQVIPGNSPPGDSYNKEGEGVPLINGPDEFRDHALDEAKKVKFTTEPTKRCKKGDILLCVRGSTTGRMNLAGFDACIGRGVAAIRSSDRVEQSYLNYFIHSRRDHIFELGSGSTFPSVSTSDVEGISIPLPPLPEQRRIVAKIEELFTNLDAGRSDLATAEQQLERYRLSVLQAAVEGRLTADWRRTHAPEPADQLLERILEKRREQWEQDYRAKYEAKGKDPPSGWKSRYTEPEPLESEEALPDLPPNWRWVSGDQMLYYVTSGSRGWSKYYDEEGQLFIRVGDISDPDIEIDFSEIQRVSLPDEERGHRSLLEPRDLLVSITADIGKVGIVPDDIEEAYINQHVALTRPSDPETTKYLAYYLISPGGGARQFRDLQKGATKAGLTLTNIKEVAIALPPASELKQIVNEVERLLSVADDAAATAEREQTRAERLRQSILKQAFSGRLVPHDEDASPPSLDGSSSASTDGTASSATASSGAESSTDGDVVAEELYNGGDPGKQIEMDL